MTSQVEDRLTALGVTLPQAAAAAGNYVGYVQSGDLVFVSGQIAMDAHGPIRGVLGANMDVDAGMAAAKLCAISILSQMKAACGGDLDRIVRVVKLGGFVNSTPDFVDQPKVINGASDFMVAVLGDKGTHARAAVSAPSLPLGVAVEIDAVIQIS